MQASQPSSPPSLATPLLLVVTLGSCAATGRPWQGPDPETASKEQPGGLYGRAFGGLTILEDDEQVYDDGTSAVGGDAEFDSGFAAGAAIGYRFGGQDWWSNLALEAEYTYRTNDVDSFQSSGTSVADSGDFASTAFMVNALYHFDTRWQFNPYVGVGFGSATEIDIDLAGPGIAGEQSFSSSSPAAQYMVGAEGAITENLNLFVEGRFFRAFDADLSGEGNPGSVEAEYGQFALLLGLSWAF